MNKVELSTLLPFYASGSLSGAEKERVEEALKAFGELNEEFEFWKGILDSARSYDPAHPPAEEIVEYSEGTVAGPALARVRAHVDTCQECQHELEILRETYQEESSTVDEKRLTVEVRLPDLFREFFRTIRTVYAAPAAAFVLLCVVIAALLSIPKREPPPVVASLPPVVTGQHQSLVLEYVPKLRSTSGTRKPTLVLSSDVTVVDVTVFLPRSMNSVRYSLSLKLPSKEIISIPGSLTPAHRDENLDTVHTSLPRDLFDMVGDFKLVAAESLPRSAHMTPEVHEYPFVVSLRSASRKP